MSETLNPQFVADVQRYCAALQDPDILALRDGSQPETEADFNLLAGLLDSQYAPQSDRYPLMRVVAPVLGELAAARQLPSNVHFVKVRGGNRRLLRASTDGVVEHTEAWMFWGQRGNHERYSRRPRALDPLHTDIARGAAVTEQGALMEFYAEPPADGQPIIAITHRNGRNGGGGRLLGPVPHLQLGSTNTLLYHGLVQFAAEQLGLGKELL